MLLCVVTSEVKSVAAGPQGAVSSTKVVTEVVPAPGIVDHHNTQTSSPANLSTHILSRLNLYFFGDWWI